MRAIFTFPNRILFGEGARSALAEELASLGASRPLLVSDPGVMAIDRVGEMREALSSHAEYLDVASNPTEQNVEAALAVFRSERCDSLVAIGGGSALDAAKAVRLLAGHPGPLGDYDVTQGGMERINQPMPPMVAVPTTAGTGSEVGRATLIQTSSSRRKIAAISPRLLPNVAICDPELTVSLSPELTAGTGMDALSHGIESYLSTAFHPICDGIALEGLRHVARGLEPAVRDGQDHDARRAMMLGALMGGISFHKGLGVIHSLSHALGGEGRAHHGTINAILLPHALRFNLPVATAKMADLASQLGVGRGLHGPSHLITLTELVLARLPLPSRLGDVPGLDPARIPEYAELAMQDHCHRTNPRPCTAADLVGLLELAW